jgi:hypothetical protein
VASFNNVIKTLFTAWISLIDCGVILTCDTSGQDTQALQTQAQEAQQMVLLSSSPREGVTP